MYVDCLQHQSTNTEPHREVSEDPSIAASVGLIQLQFAPRINMGEHAPAEVHTTRDGTFHANQVMRLGIDPHPSFEPGQRLCFRVWRIELRVRLVVDYDLQRAFISA